MSEWHWRPGLIGWAFHAGAGTVWIQYGWRAVYPDGPDGPMVRVALPAAREADAFDVAFVVAGRPVERLRLRGPLERLQERLPAALARYVARPSPPPAAPEPRWNGPGCWCHLHAGEG